MRKMRAAGPRQWLRRLPVLEALGRQYMEIIRKANDDIPDTQISNKLYRMEMIIGKIFEYIKSYPQKPTVVPVPGLLYANDHKVGGNIPGY